MNNAIQKASPWGILPTIGFSLVVFTAFLVIEELRFSLSNPKRGCSTKEPPQKIIARLSANKQIEIIKGKNIDHAPRVNLCTNANVKADK